MDKQQAKFLLSSFRPDGADASLSDFADALRLAAEDRDLGEWLAQERAADAAFAEALNEVTIPDGLRDEILAVLEHDGGLREADDDLDSLLAGGLVTISPPTDLRDQILTAMELERSQQKQAPDNVISNHNVWGWLSLAGIAAAVAVVTFVTFSPSNGEDPENIASINYPSPVINNTSIQQVAVQSVMTQMAAKLKTGEEIDLNTDLTCTDDAMDYLRTKDHPVPNQLPSGLENAKLIGARDMYLDNGQPISLLCFKKEGLGMVHLIVVDSSSLSDANKLATMESISLKSCFGCKKTKFNIAHWREGDKAYMLLTKANKQEMVNLF